MKLNKIFICTLLIILSSSLVLAICPEDPGCELNLIEMDSADIALLSQDQLANVPPEKLDFSKLSIDQISQLSSGQKISVSVDQIKDHLDKLGDLGDYFAAPEAIQEKYGVGIDNFGSGAIISEGVLKATSGEKEQFDFSNKQNWKVSINPDGIVTILEPKEISQGSISEKDVFTLFEETVFVSNEGSSQKVKGLSFNDGKIFVKKGDTAEIGTYHISSDKNDVIIFFDPKVSPDGNSVLISDKKIAISTIKTGTVKVQPQLGNKLFNMLMRKYEHDRNNDPIPGKFSLVPDDLDSLEISVSNGDSLEVESREDIVKTPLLKHKDGGGSTIIDTGKMKISINKGKLKVTPPEPIYGFDGLIVIKNSVAFELVSDSFKETLRTSSSNRFILLNNGKEIAGNNLGLRVSDQIEFNLLKGIDDLKISNPKLKFTVSKGMGDRVSPNIIQLLEEWLEDKPEIEKYLDVISITLKRGATADVILDRYDSISLPGKNKRGPKFVALISIGERSSDPATVDDKNVRDIKNPLGTLDHEFQHILDMNVKNMVENFENIKDPFAELEAGLDDSKKMDHNQVGIPESKSLMDIYQDEAATIATSLYTDPQFLDLLKKVKGFTGYDSQIDLILQGKINDLSVEDRASLIGNLGNHLKFNPDKVQSPQLYQQFNALVQKKTNLYPYSFFPGAFELPATYGEKGVKDAQQNRRLAQIKYDAFHSLPNPPPPAWLKKEKEDRYYAVMGGKDGNYCKENSCGPCLIYVKSCRKQ